MHYHQIYYIDSHQIYIYYIYILYRYTDSIDRYIDTFVVYDDHRSFSFKLFFFYYLLKNCTSNKKKKTKIKFEKLIIIHITYRCHINCKIFRFLVFCLDWEEGFVLKGFNSLDPEWSFQFSQLKVDLSIQLSIKLSIELSVYPSRYLTIFGYLSFQSS